MKKLLLVSMLISFYTECNNHSHIFKKNRETSTERNFNEVFFTICGIIKSLVDIQNQNSDDISIDDYLYFGNDGNIYAAKTFGNYNAESCLFYQYQLYLIMQSVFSAIPLYQYLAYLEETGDLSPASSIDDIAQALSQKPCDFFLDIPLSNDNSFAQYFWMAEMMTLWMELNLPL